MEIPKLSMEIHNELWSSIIELLRSVINYRAPRLCFTPFGTPYYGLF